MTNREACQHIRRRLAQLAALRIDAACAGDKLTVSVLKAQEAEHRRQLERLGGSNKEVTHGRRR